jgi:phage-related protein
MATFSFTPSFPIAESSQPKVKRFQAGDGYEQRVKFGLRTDPKEWDVSFNNRTDTERNSILTFFETAAGATSFDWTNPRGIAGKYVCEVWSFDSPTCNTNNIKAKFRQVFEP